MAQQFEHFDQRIADGLIKANSAITGLPQFLGAQITAVTAGHLTATVSVRPDLITPLGTLHGGVMAALVDHVLGCVMYPLMPRGYWAATTEFKVNYLAAVRTGAIIAEATVLAMTKRTAVVRIDVTNEGQLACIAQGTVLIVAPKANG
ncbi:MAG: PaaI family thioesterase [Deltaproteobacteria bacterium]|nr:PaaI family thioesterase [Deltaproteobacteria bacterium]MBI3386222.1 PaaI family thioesterase [Deltaproteobacteria bacterium]